MALTLDGTTGISATGNIYGGNIIVTNALSVGNFAPTVLSSTGNVTGGNILTPGVVSATGNVTGNYVLGNGALLTGVITSVANINSGTSNVTVVSSGGNITVGVGGTSNVAVFATTGEYITGILSATGNVSAPYFIGNGAALTGLSASKIYNGTSEANIGTSGGNANISINGTSNVVVVASTGVLVTGVVSASGNVTGANVNTNTIVGTGLTLNSTGNLNLSASGNVVVNSKYINGVTDPAQAQDVATKNYVDNMVSSQLNYHAPVTAATTTTLATTTGGTITYTQPNGAGNGVGALLTTTGAFNLIDTANVQTVGTRILVKNEGNAVYNGIYTWANATNIVRALDSDEYGPDSANAMSVNDYFFVSAGNVNVGSAWVVSGPTGTITFGTSNITFGQFSTSQVYSAGTGLTLNGTVFSVNASQTQVTSVGTLGSLTVTANVAGGNLTTAGQVSATANVTGGNILTAGIMSSTGNATHSNLTVSTGTVTLGNIVNANGNAVGNIGSSSAYFNTIFGKATTAQYADLAELYAADANYVSGTVLDFGGANEVTLSTDAGSARIAGVVSTNPAHLMNSTLAGEHIVAVALTGRVPTQVTGTVRKGDMMVSAGNGYAQASAAPAMGTVIGKALADFDGASGTIEIVVGRL